jgi:hypothetical protein
MVDGSILGLKRTGDEAGKSDCKDEAMQAHDRPNKLHVMEDRLIKALLLSRALTRKGREPH